MKSIFIWITAFAIVSGISLFVGYTKGIIGDQYFYYQQAGNPFSYIESPFSGRTLLPLLAYILPAPIKWSFYCLTLAALTSSPVFLYETLRSYQIPKFAIFISLLPLLLDSRFADMIYNYFYTDGLTCFFVCLAMYTAVHQKDKLFAAAFLLGVLNHEIMFMYAPFLFFLRHNKLRKKSIYSFLLLILPGIVGYYLSRTIAYSLSDLSFLNSYLDNVYGIKATSSIYQDVFGNNLSWLQNNMPDDWQRLVQVGCYGFFIYAPVVYLICIIKPSKGTVLLLSLLVPAALVVAVSQMTDRLLFFSYPVFVLLYPQLISKFSVIHQACIGILILLHILVPYPTIIFVVHFLYLLVLMSMKYKRIGLLPNSEQKETNSEYKQSLQSAWNPAVISVLVFMLFISIGKAYCSSDFLIRFNRLIQDDGTVLGFQSTPIQHASYSLPNRQSIEVISTVGSTESVYIPISMMQPSFQSAECVSMILLIHPITPSQVRIELQSTGNETQQVYTLPFYNTENDVVRISKPIYFDLPTEKDTIMLSLSPGLLLVDILFFDSSWVYPFQRQEVLQLKGHEVEKM